MYALSLADGCAYWTFDADTQVRTAMTVSDDRGTTSPSIFFADVAANVYSIDALTGQLRWKKKVDDHPVARVTGTPRFHDNWDFDTARDFKTVNNVAAQGGSIDVGGPAVAEGIVLTTSGYPTFGGRSGTVLLAFSVDGR